MTFVNPSRRCISVEKEDHLLQVNRDFLELVAAILGITTPLTSSTDYDSHGVRTERLVSICQAAGATTYLSGPAAKAYLDETEFEQAGIAVSWMHYGSMSRVPAAVPSISSAADNMLDLLFNVGVAAPNYLQGGS